MIKSFVGTLFVFLMLPLSAFAQDDSDFYLAENGVTIMCPDASEGDLGSVNGVEYEAVTRYLLAVRRNQGADLTILCTSLVTDLSGFFKGSSFNQPIGSWDVSNVESMYEMFRDSEFNQPIGSWDVGSVTNMGRMFWGSAFNQHIGDWDVSSVTDMERMFDSTDFNQSIDSWNVGNVQDMSFMFATSAFNQPLDSWDVSSATSMAYMFRNSVFNQPIESWDVSSVISMPAMFEGSAFNQPLSGWDVGSVTTMAYMFRNSVFNQPIAGWDAGSVTDMFGMFQSSLFNQPIGDWDVSSVVRMQSMFRLSQFNQPIGDWDVSNVNDTSRMFSESPFNQNIEDWDVGSVTDMSGMFAYAPFDQPIAGWNVENVTDMSLMFVSASFNQPLSGWDVRRVSSMSLMFESSEFNQPIEDWDVSRVVNMRRMFRDSPFNQPLNNWNTGRVENMIEMFRNSDFNQPLDKWDVSYVRLMHSMFYNAGSFDQDLSSWCTTFINLPPGFAEGSAMQSNVLPEWGRCIKGTYEIQQMEASTGIFAMFADGWVFNQAQTFSIEVKRNTDGSRLFFTATPFDIGDMYNYDRRILFEITEDNVTILDPVSDFGFLCSQDVILGPTTNIKGSFDPDNTNEFTFAIRENVNEVCGQTYGEILFTASKTGTSIDDGINPEQPQQITLSQNYPNPFNPVTQIQYKLPESAEVRLDVYNITGQRVAILVNDTQHSGTHTVPFDAGQLASGVYLYRLSAGSFVQTRKMLLVK